MADKKIAHKKNIKLSLVLSLAVISLFVFSARAVMAQGCEIGAFVGNGDHITPTAQEVQNFENLAGRHVSSVLLYWAWNDGLFPTEGLNQGIRNHDGYDTQTVVHLTWEPWSRAGSGDSSFILEDIIAGTHDEYIRAFAQGCADWADPIRLRFMHEMIQDDNSATPGWYPWQDKPELYKQAWNRVHVIFKQEDATNVEFVWAPNNFPFDAATIAKYYPGIEKVDWLGMDGYNAGEDGLPGWPSWQNFYDVFSSLYQTYLTNPEIFGEKKIMLAEFASAESPFPVDKEAWMLQAFNAIKNDFTEIDAFYWFNTLKEADWRVDSSPESLAAFQQVMSDLYFTSHVVPEPSSLFLLASGVSGMLLFTGVKKRKEGGKIS